MNTSSYTDSTIRSNEQIPSLISTINRLKHNNPHLENGEIVKLVDLANNGNESACERIILSNLGLITHCIRKLEIPRGLLSFEDLFMSGIIGLRNAIKKFKSSRKINFSTYASKVIERELERYIAQHCYSSKMTSQDYEKIKKIYGAYKSFFARNGTQPTYQELVAELNYSLDIDEIKTLLTLNARYKGTYSLDEYSINDENNTVRLLEFIPNSDITPEELAVNQSLALEINNIINNNLASFSARDLFILRNRLPFEGNAKMTLEEIRNILQMSREGIRQVEKRTIRKIRKLLLEQKNVPQN